MITAALKNKAGRVLQSLLTVKEAARNEPINSQTRKEQFARIDNVIKNYPQSDLDFQKVFDLLKEEFGGSFGELPEGSGLLKALRDQYLLIKDASDTLRQELLVNYIIDKEFESGPLIGFAERHGGWAFFNVEQFTLKFLANGTVRITIDKSLSKTISPLTESVNIIVNKYDELYVSPQFMFGKIEYEDKRSFHFETVYQNLDYLYLEEPQFWKESMLLKRKLV